MEGRSAATDPLVLPVAAIVSGILLGRALTFSGSNAAWPAAVFFVLALLSTPRLRRWCLLLALIFTGAFADAWHRPGPRPQIDAGSRETVILAGCVVEPTVLSPGREQFTLELDPGARARVSLPLEDEGPLQRLEYGQRVEIEARLRPPRNFNNPGSFDYAGYLARQQVFWAASMTRGSTARVLPGRCGWRAMAWIFALRGLALDRIERLYADAYTSGMMQAMLIGESSQLQKIWTENFRRTGTFHALVISGAHVAVLAGVLLFLLRMCSLGEIPALTLTAAAAWLYALVSGFSPPVARAAAGFTLYLIARFFFRRGRVLNLLAAVAVVYLLCDPGDLGDASFQLSFLCVAALGALAAPLLEATSGSYARGLRDIQNREADPHLAPRVAQFRIEVRLAAETLESWCRVPAGWCAEGIALLARAGIFVYEMALISLAIQIGLALPMVVYFHRISFTGLTANVIIVPLLEAAVPIGFLAIFTGWHAAAGVAGWLLKIAARTADWHAGLEPAWRVSSPPLWLALSFAASLMVFAAAMRGARWRKRTAFPAGLVVAGLFGLVLWQPWTAPVPTHSLELTAIDVGQGDSLLVVFPEGRTMVIDGGGVLQFGPRAGAPQAKPARRSNLDTGEDVVSPYLWSRGIRRIDILVATHAHQDHSGGLPALLENFRPRELWVGANPSATVLQRAAELRIFVRAPDASSPAANYGGARLEVVSPPPGFSPAKPGNNDSLALRVTYGANSFLLTGDLESPMERLLLSDGRALHADVLKVGHHGSKTSTSSDFLDAVSPSIAIISAGFENSFGHPHPAVLARLAQRHTAILRTDRDGLITVRSDGHKLWFDSMLWHPQSAADVFNWALATTLPDCNRQIGIRRILIQWGDSVPCQRRTRTISLRFLTATLAFSLSIGALSSPRVYAAASESETEVNLAIVDKYVDATHVQEEKLRGIQMEVNIDAQLPKLEKHGKLRALRKISLLGKITYKALGFSGDNTVKQEVITRYLAAETAARENGTIAITPANYKFRYAGRLVQNGVTTQILDITPRKKAVGLFKGQIWIDAASGMPIREIGQFVKTPSVFLKKIAFVRDYEIRNGIAFPSHIQSTVDTRIVGRAELEINFSNFTREDSADDEATADDGSQSSTPAVPVHQHAPQPVGALQEINTSGTADGPES